jgi:hypothetical protein
LRGWRCTLRHWSCVASSHTPYCGTQLSWRRSEECRMREEKCSLWSHRQRLSVIYNDTTAAAVGDFQGNAHAHAQPF